MRVINANAYEFDAVESEQDLTLAFAACREFADANSFLRACPDASSHDISNLDPIPYSSFARSIVRNNILKFHGQDIPADAELFVINDSWDDLEFIAVFQLGYFWYHWFTTA